jgi:hypothetical protein
MTQRKGLLLVTMEPAAPLEDEFNAWYDTEHLPQRKTIAGIETAQRFVCLTGWPRYLATYDLSSLSVIDGEAYQAVSGSRSSPWSQRMLAKAIGYYRAVAEQVYPGDAAAGHHQQTLRLVLVRFTQAAEEQEGVIVEGLRTIFDQQSGLAQLRVFKSARRPGCDFLALAEFRTLVSESAISAVSVSGVHADLVNIYTPYWRHSERN